MRAFKFKGTNFNKKLHLSCNSQLELQLATPLHIKQQRTDKQEITLYSVII